MSVSEQIDQFIAENGGNTRDALNVALTRIEQMEMKLAAVRANVQMEVAKARFEVQKKLLSGGLVDESDVVIMIFKPENLPDSR